MNNAFAMDLYGRLAGGNVKNVFFSPTSVQTALAMAWAGARGATAEEMARTLHLPNDPGGAGQVGAYLRNLNGAGDQRGYELSVANALWGMKGYPFQLAYLQTVEKEYGGHLAELDFANASDAARQTINDWVAQQTRDKIKDLMPAGSVTPATRLVLTNAIYFKGKWDLPFPKAQTQDAEFTTGDGQKVKVPLMYQQAHLRYAEDDTVQMLELPYGRGELAMRIFLPKAADGLPAFEKGLTEQRLNDLAGHATSPEVRVWLPRFKLETGYELQKDLPQMGMRLAFTGQADFSGMSSAERFYIDLVVHKAFVNVDEEGTEAAAATGVGMRATAIAIHREPKVFRGDHPFLFAIVHRSSGAMLFMGRLENP
ncbi:MAG TPA: serpin family protein [Tepidisphaeraceae bacterium]